VSISLSPPPVNELSAEQYRLLAEFRHRIREFLHFSEEAARQQGIEPQQHQLLLALQGLPANEKPTVSVLAARLCIRHHSAVELINRLSERGAVVRRNSDQDRREVLVELTDKGQTILRSLSVLHWHQLRESGAELARALESIIEQSASELRSHA
jgi:DNA-binding MarR family transcriptional regulator